jgi:hypothetical protein
MSNGLVNGKIYLKEKEINVEKIVFKEEDQMMLFLGNKADYKSLESKDCFDVHFNDAVLLNCDVNGFDELKKACVGCYSVKRNLF